MNRPKTSGDAVRTLATLAPGEVGQVTAITVVEPHGARLAGLGLHEGVGVTVVRAGDPLILKIGRTRIGLARRLAAAIQVQSTQPERTAAHAANN